MLPMSEDREAPELSLARKREIFRELVTCQDAGMSVEQSRTQMASYFSISVALLKEIEVLGLEKGWPPLG
jgi:hypothetical protein